MSLRYTRQSGDQSYRKVSLSSSKAPGSFTEFREENETIFCNDKIVLEIRKTDGTCVIVGTELGNEPQRVKVQRKGNVFAMDNRIPVARLWVQKSDGTGIRYKAPSQWEEDPENRSIRCLVPGGIGSLRLVGDSYFHAAFELFE